LIIIKNFYNINNKKINVKCESRRETLARWDSFFPSVIEVRIMVEFLGTYLVIVK
jgi:hypothetical protein